MSTRWCAIITGTTPVTLVGDNPDAVGIVQAMDHLIYLVGQPGAGKSTLMARLTEPFDRHAVPDVLLTDNMVAHDVLMLRDSPEIVGAELGKRRDAFSGTDALPSAVIDKAVPWIATRPYPLILAEGARLANKRFLYAGLDAGYAVTLVLLDHDDAETWRKLRAKQIGRTQNPAWVKGRLSASRNLADAFEHAPGGTVVRGAPDDVFEGLRSVISGG
jgi:hypothetical protein